MTEALTTTDPIQIEQRTLADFYAADSAEMSALELDSPAREALEEEVTQMGPGIVEAFTFAATLAVLYEALDVALTDILKSGWQTMARLQEYRDPKKHPVEETNWVTLGDHKIVSAHKPKVEVLFNGKLVGELIFDATLTLNVHDAKLRVKGARIWEVTGPVFEGEASLSYKGFQLLKKTIARFTLPSGVSFQGGVPIIPFPIAAS